MTPRKIARLRRRLRYVLGKCFPQADAIDIGLAVKRLEQLMIYEAFDLVAMEHGNACACWHCVERLHCEVMRHRAQMEVRREMAEDYD